MTVIRITVIPCYLVRMTVKIRSVRLDDEVWECVKGLSMSLNQYLRDELLRKVGPVTESGEVTLVQSPEGAAEAVRKMPRRQFSPLLKPGQK